MLITVAAYAVGALLAASLGLYAFLRRSFTFWQLRKVPFVSPSVPFGNYKDTILGKRSLTMVVQDIYKAHRDQPYVGTYFLATPMMHLHDVDIIQQVFIKEFQDFNGRGMRFDTDIDPLSGHLFRLSGPAWKNLRLKLSPTFTAGKLKYMFNAISECNDNLRERIDTKLAEGHGTYKEDIQELVARLFTDIISSVAFGIESNSIKNPDSEFRRMGARVFESSFSVNLRHLLIFFNGAILKFFGIRCVPSDVYEFFTRIVDEVVEHREKNNVERADMLNLLIKLKNDGFVPVDGPGEETSDSQDSSSKQVKQKLEQHQIAAQVFIFFVAGFETTSMTTAFSLYELAKNPEIQARVQQEVDAAFKKCNGKLTFDALQDMPYMEMVIQETLRFYPPAPFLTREAMVRRQLPLTDVVLEKGTRLIIPVWSIHMDPEYWEDPERFDPTRFTEEAKKARRPGVYMPFGEGPRLCIGARMGMVEVKMALASMLSKVTVTLAPGMPRQARFSPRCLLPHPIDGIELTLTARQGC